MGLGTLVWGWGQSMELVAIYGVGGNLWGGGDLWGWGHLYRAGDAAMGLGAICGVGGRSMGLETLLWGWGQSVGWGRSVGLGTPL